MCDIVTARRGATAAPNNSMRDAQMASTTEFVDERINLSKDAPKQARPRKKILVPPKPHEKR